MHRNHMYRIVGITVGIWVAGRQGIARAQTGPDKAAADRLLSEGKARLIKGDVAAACALFETSIDESIQLDTQLALASCYEKLGKTASAWREFRAAADTASAARDRRLRFAKERVATLEPKLSRLRLVLAPADRTTALTIKLDGAVVSTAEFNAPLPIDPGRHTIEISAPARITWSKKVLISSPGVVEIAVPAFHQVQTHLEQSRREPGSAAAKPVDDTRHSRRMLAYATGAGGAGLVGASLVFGAVANSRWGNAQSRCHQNQCDPAGIDLAHSAQTMGNVSTGLFVVGAAVIATGIVLYLTAEPSGPEPATDRTALRIVPGVAVTQFGLTLQGGF